MAIRYRYLRADQAFTRIAENANARGSIALDQGGFE